MIQKRDLVINLLLTIFTCGLYGLVWFIIITDDVNTASNEDEASGAMSLLLTIITCGLYGIYWSYRMGKQLYRAKEKRNMVASDNSILYLILSIINLSIVNYCLIQLDLNEIAKYEETV